MSKEVKRYVPEYCESGGEIWAEMQEDSEGGWVPHSDYKALLAERDRLAEALATAHKEAVYGLKHARSFLQASAALGRISAHTDAALQGEQPCSQR